jgi:hypothetical protein
MAHGRKKEPMSSKYLIAVAALAVTVSAPAAAAEAREPVTRAAVVAAAERLASQSAAGLEQLTNGAASVDRSRTTVGHYVRHGKFSRGASFELFGTNTVNGQARPFRCVGTVGLIHAKSGGERVAADLTCPLS